MRHVLGTSAALALLSFTATAAFTTAALAAPALRVQVDQHGDFIQIGNTLGIECAAGTPAPVVGTIANGACNQSNQNVNDSSPDLYWVSDNPMNGQALASQATMAGEARSTAVLTIPVGATVTHAYLYWGAESSNGMADSQVTLDRPGGFTQAVMATQSFLPGVGNAYQSVADITAVVQAQGSGAYRVSGIDVAPFANVNDNGAFGGWSIVVLYQSAAEPLRNLAIFDGLDAVSNGNNQMATLSGFLVPNAGFDGKLGIIAYEGDNAIVGDQLFFNGGAALSGTQNPANNFFNGSRSRLDLPISVVGDLPQLTGTPQSMGGIDLDVVDITSKLTAGQTSAMVQATTTGDQYYLGAFITSISTFKPDFSTSTKTALDVNGGSLIAGDTLQYTISVTNTGNDASVNTVLTDVLPAGVTFVPGSLSIVSGPNAGAKTDAAADDQAEYVQATNTVSFRVGTGANGAQGGSLAIGGTSTVTFQVTVNSGFVGSVANQANVTAAGLLGAPAATTPTDGNGPASGNPPTTVVVDQCGSNANCMAPTGVCDLNLSPHVCVGCVVDTDCGNASSGLVCDPTLTCVMGCRGTGGNGCMPNLVCTSSDATIGQCIGCKVDGDCGSATSGHVCDQTNQTCVAGCRGTGGNGCDPNATTNVCTSTDGTIGQCVDCLVDSDCGGPMSGKVCDAASHGCIDGCRGQMGNGCVPGLECTSMSTDIGQCITASTSSSSSSSSSSTGTGAGTGTGTGGAGSGGAGGAPTNQLFAEGAGFGCSVSSEGTSSTTGWLVALALSGAVGLGRRRHRRS